MFFGVNLFLKRNNVHRSSRWRNWKQTCDFPNLRGMCVWPESLKKAAVSIRQWNGTVGVVHEGRSGLADNMVRAVFPWSTQNKAVDTDSFPRNLGFIFFFHSRMAPVRGFSVFPRTGLVEFVFGVCGTYWKRGDLFITFHHRKEPSSLKSCSECQWKLQVWLNW